MTTVTLIPTARATFAVDIAAERVAAARSLLEELGATVQGPAELFMDDAGVRASKAYVNDSADLLLHVCASFCDAGPAQQLYAGVGRPVLLWAFREPGPVGDRLWLNSMCGANLIGHALVRAGGEVRLLYGDPDEPGVRETLARALAGELPPIPELPGSTGERASAAVAEAALAQLDGERIGVIGEAPPGFTPSEFEPGVLDQFGLSVEPLELDTLFEQIRAVPTERRAAEVEAACEWQPSLKDTDSGTLDRFAAVTTSLRDWQSSSGVSSLAIRCWPEFPAQMKVCPCSSLSRLADEDIPTQCERDVYGAVTMLLLRALGASPTYLVDTVDLDAERNVVRFWHCGAAATQLAADPDDATQYIHCNRKIGVAGNFPLKTGPVIAIRLTEMPGDPQHLRMLIVAGESVPATNHFQGNTADVRLDCDATTFVQSLTTGGFPHHTVLAWTDVRPGLRAVADKLGISVVEFTQSLQGV